MLTERAGARGWPAIALARACGGSPRVPFVLEQAPDTVLGSVAVDHLAVLRRYPDAFALTPGGVALRLPVGERDDRLAEVHADLRDQGLIVAWRDEPYPLRGRDGVVHGIIERAASRFWGTLTLGAHCNGYVADAQGRPTHLWIARRAETKPTDPGRLDNLVGGGVPAGQTPREALVREGWEEAGLVPDQMQGAVAHEVIELECDIPEGRQLEHLHVFDLELPAGVSPRAIDGEVEWHRCLPVAEALARAAAGELTTDAALVTLAFALRWQLLEPAAAAAESTRAGVELDASQARAFAALVARGAGAGAANPDFSTIQTH